jgi:hypothetical protein
VWHGVPQSPRTLGVVAAPLEGLGLAPFLLRADLGGEARLRLLAGRLWPSAVASSYTFTHTM